jgi:hypothetical protein
MENGKDILRDEELDEFNGRFPNLIISEVSEEVEEMLAATGNCLIEQVEILDREGHSLIGDVFVAKSEDEDYVISVHKNKQIVDNFDPSTTRDSLHDIVEGNFKW